MNEHDDRPWGSYTILDRGDGYQVKRIEVKPGSRLSYQKHAHRSEHWMVVNGQALVTLDGKDIRLANGQTVDIPSEVGHRAANPGEDPLVFIEIQRGSYLGEDDIVRLEDDYGRTG
ncbi:MAG: phosphomannose isomerase type II C-terminal cupin domain [Chloroflexota bacterium]